MESPFTHYPSQLENGHILAVEDSLVQAKMLQYFFDQNNINAKIFNNAYDAYNSAVENPPVLVISDIVMPGMDGYELCLKLKNNAALCNVPVILLTALRDPLDIVKGLQAGADNFITKPYDEHYLLSRIIYLLANIDISPDAEDRYKVIEIAFQGNKYQINSDKKQILNLLLSVYEAAIIRNNELIVAKQQLEDINSNLKTANEQLDAFARTVSHDLRSPLTGIIGFTELTLDDYSGNLDNEVVKNLNWVLSSANKMSDLIADLLNYSRSSRAEIKYEPINFSQLAYEVIDDIKARYPENGVRFKVHENLRVIADPALMRVVLNNLLGNAVKYSSKNEHPEVTFGSTIVYGQNVFFVSDNGAGFNMEKASKLFDPFVRLHSNQEFPGTGVGLSTVKNICARHHGDIWAESEIGLGATFYFSIGDNN